jgi:hypothetical protein
MERTVMIVLGIFVLCSFYAFSVISFQKYRLPKREREYKRVRKIFEKAEDDSQLLNEMFQTEYKVKDYILPVIFVTLFCVLGFYVLFKDEPPLLLTGVDCLFDSNLSKLSYSRLSLVAIGFAILGSYVWSIQYIVRRLITLDLNPGAYYSIGTRIIFATFLSIVFHHLIQSMEPANKKELLDALPVLAFFTGMFPQRAMQYMQDKTIIFSKKRKNIAHQLPLGMIEGITLFSRVRLAEVGIENAQNLAEANLEELILKTPFNPRLLIDWITQAKLYIAFKDDIIELRKAGIRTIFDLQAVGMKNGFDAIEILTNIKKPLLTTIHDAIAQDPDKSVLDDLRKKISHL